MTSTIGSVKDQLATWGNRRAAKNADEPQRETLDSRDLTVLGTLGRSSFARTKDGRELKLKGPAMPHTLEHMPNDVIVVRQPVRAADSRVRIDTYLAVVQEPGTYSRLAKRKSYTPRQRPPSPIDRDHELRNGSPRQWLALGKDGDTPEDVIRGAMSHMPSLMITDGLPALRSVADEVAMIQRAGVTLALSADGAHLLAASPKGLSALVRGMLGIRAPLYVAHLKGEPVRCAWPHARGGVPEAVTIAVGNSPVCANHLAGTPSDAA